MTVAALCLAVAVLLAPGPAARSRIRSVTGTGAAARTVRSPLVLGACAAVAAALVAGVSVALATSILVATAVWRIRGRRRAQASDADQRMLLGALETVIAELRVGNHPAEACAAAANETGGPAADAFRVAAARARLGGSAADGLRGAPDPLGAHLERVAAAWTVSDRHGLALAELLSATRTDLLGRIRLRSRTEAGLAGARATATVLAGLPALGVALGQAMGAAPIAVLLGGGLGGALLVFGTGLACAGLVWTDRISARVAS